MNQTTPQSWPQFKLRLPPELKSWLHGRSQANERTQNGELIYILRQAREADQKPAGGKP